MLSVLQEVQAYFDGQPDACDWWLGGDKAADANVSEQWASVDTHCRANCIYK